MEEEELEHNTSALVFGGRTPGDAYLSGQTESWNGTTWTEVK
jgi:hypothetical protein